MASEELLATGIGLSAHMGSKDKRYVFKVDNINFAQEVLDKIKDSIEGEPDKDKFLSIGKNYFRGRKVSIYVK